MSFSKAEALMLLQVGYVLAVLGMALLTVWLTRLHDAREDRRRVLRRPPLDSTVG